MERSVLMVTDSGRAHAEEGPAVAFDDVALPFVLLRCFGATVTLASRDGGPVAIGRDSMPEHFTGRLGEARAAMSDTASLRDRRLDLSSFGAVFVTHARGGPGELDGDPAARAAIAAIASRGAVVATIGNGSVALLGMSDACGARFLDGRRLTVSFDRERDPAAERSFAERFESEGASVVSEPPRAEHVSVDASLVTGQNPASAVATAAIVLAFLESFRQRRSA